MVYYSGFGLILAMVGAFLAFTSASSIIDFERKRVIFSNNLFGFNQTGSWMNINEKMKIGNKNRILFDDHTAEAIKVLI